MSLYGELYRIAHAKAASEGDARHRPDPTLNVNVNFGPIRVNGHLAVVVKHPGPQPPDYDEIIPVVTATCDGFTATSRGTQMAYTLPVDKFVQFKIGYVDKNQNPAKVDGNPVWS